tara:strand:- start:542 stop:910 length:369 start_codon:yes stop_codon:yes gene_type:complete
MSLSSTPSITYITSRMVKETDVNNTPNGNITGTNSKLYSLDLNNTHSQKAFFKIYDLGAVTYGTSLPDISIPVPNGTRQTVTIAEGVSFTNAVSWAASQGPATLAGSALTGGALVAIATLID